MAEPTYVLTEEEEALKKSKKELLALRDAGIISGFIKDRLYFQPRSVIDRELEKIKSLQAAGKPVTKYDLDFTSELPETPVSPIVSGSEKMLAPQPFPLVLEPKVSETIQKKAESEAQLKGKLGRTYTVETTSPEGQPIETEVPAEDILREKEAIVEKVKGPRVIGGQKALGPIPPSQVGQLEEPAGWVDVFSRQELMTKEERKQLEESGVLGTAVSRLLFTEDPEGKVVESGVAYLGRMLGMPSELIAAGGEMLLSPEARKQGLSKTLQRRIKQGEGLGGAGQDLGESLMDAMGVDKNSTLYKVGSVGTWVLGTAADFMVPSTAEYMAIPLKIAKANKAIAAIPEATRGSRFLAKPGVAGKAKQVAKAVFSPDQFISEMPENAAVNGLRKFSTNPANMMDTVDIVRKGFDSPDILTNASRLGLVETSSRGGQKFNKGVADAALLDAVSKAKTPEVKAEVIRAYQSLMQGVEDAEGAGTLVRMGPHQPPKIADIPDLATITTTEKDLFDAEDLLSESLLKLSGQRQIVQVNDFISKTNPDVRIGKAVVPASEARNISQKLRDIVAPVDVSGQVKTAIRNGAKRGFKIQLDDASRAAIESADLPLPNTTTIVKDGVKTEVVALDDWNDWVQQSLEVLAEKSPLARAEVRTTTSVVEPLVRPIKKAAAAAAEATLPKLAVLNRLNEARMQKIAARTLSQSDKALVKEAKQKLGSLDREFRYSLLQKIKEGKSKGDAFADTIIEGYTKPSNLKRVEVDGEVVFKDPKGINPDLSPEDLAGDLFDDFISTIFGAEEKVVQAATTLFGTSVPGINPNTFRSALADIYTNSDAPLSKAKATFKELIAQGKNKEATEFLFKLHKGAEGRPLSFLGPTTKINDSIEVAIPSSRSVDALSYSYLNRRSADIVGDVARKQNPFLFRFSKIGDRMLESISQNIKNDFIVQARSTFDDMGETGEVIASMIGDQAQSNKKAFSETLKAFYLNEDQTKLNAIVDNYAKQITDGILETTPDAFGVVDDAEAYARVRQLVLDKLQRNKDRIQEVVREVEPRLDLVQPGKTQKIIAETLIKNMSGEKPRIPADVIKLLKSTSSGSIIMSELESARGIAQAGRTLDNIRLLPVTIVTDLPAGASADDLIKAISSLELGEDLAGRTQRFLQLVGDIAREPRKLGAILDRGALAGLSSAETLIKSGMLAGSVFPNFAYHAQNILTAPLIIYSTLGGKAAKGAGVDLLFANPKVNRAVDELYGVADSWGSPSKVDSALRKDAIKASVVTTPAGVEYTSEQIANLIAKNKISTTEDAMELSKAVLSDFAKWAGKNLSGKDIGTAKQVIREFDPTKPNIWVEMANYFDTRFRTGVLIRALEEGKTEQEALQMARDALFDYSKISDFERRSIAKAAWFYSFERSAIGQTLSNLLLNPRRFKNEQRFQHIMADDYDERVPDSEYRQNNMFLKTLKDSRERYRVYGPAVPQGAALVSLVDYLGSLMPFIEGAVSLPTGDIGGAAVKTGEGIQKVAKTLGERTGASSYITIPLTTYGKELKAGELSDPTEFVDPRIIAYVKAMPGMWDRFVGFLKLEPIAQIPEEGQLPPDATWEGLGYRIRKDDEASKQRYLAILELAKTLGQQRFMREAGAAIGGLEDRTGEITPTKLEVDPGWIEMLRNLGIIKLDTDLGGETMKSQARKQIIKEVEAQ